MKRILLLTKNYPPQLWWMEKYALELHHNLIKSWDKVFLIKSLPRINFLYKFKFLYFPFEFFRLFSFFLYVLVIGIFLIRRIDIIWSVDWSISFLWPLLWYFWKKSTLKYVTIHGKDISWDFPGYNYLLKFSFKRTDKIYAVSEFIRMNILRRFPDMENKIYLSTHSILNISFPICPFFDRNTFLDNYNIPRDKVLLFSLWRFVKKKWLDWFVSNVLPFLDKKFHYILWWFWPLEKSILDWVQHNKIYNFTFLWPVTNDIEKAKFYSSANYFVMPNISIKEDVEWFGIVLLEANYYNLPIILSDADSIDQKREIDVPIFVIKQKDANNWIHTINNLC